MVGRGESHRHTFERLLQQLRGLALGDALHRQEMLFGRESDRFDGKEPGLFQRLNIVGRDAIALEIQIDSFSYCPVKL